MKEGRQMPGSILIAEGKTKILTQYQRLETQVVIGNKHVVTWDDRYQEPMAGKGGWCTATTANVFTFLADRHVPVAFEGELSETEFLAPRCEMIPVEVVIRLGVEEKSSLRKRNPDVPVGPLAEPLVELFLKTSDKVFEGIELSTDDPYIHEYDANGMRVHPPKQPIGETLGTHIPYTPAFGPTPVETLEQMKVIGRRVGLL
ncbi:MAG TPA: phosphoribosylaminoimidazolesuccinocarboxamide synthase, partial [Candidatus Paceibacterota bacterium]|nr:phosphoribosylaminoimidazolesuccinocarboxamide synthase [Candidatus Paceibacterota bacterium]